MRREEVGVSVLDHLPLGVEHADSPARHCSFIAAARRGRSLWAAGDDITCPLARYNLGIDTPNEETIAALAKTLVGWGDSDNEEMARRFIAGLDPLPFGQRVFVYCRLDDAPFPPDLVIHFLTPAEAMEKLVAISASTGLRCHSPAGGVGALCGECTATPLLSEGGALSAGCPGSRGEACLGEEELFLSLPYPLYSSLAKR